VTFENIRARLQEAVAGNRIPGAVIAVTDRRETVWQEAFGFADRESERAQQTNDIFFIASSSKPLAATTVFLLAESGRLALDEHLKRLLSHSAGIFGNDTKDLVERDLLRNAGRSLADAAAGIAARPLIYPPGESAVYSDAGIMLAGRAAEVAAGREFHDVMREVLLDPLGMLDTFYRNAGDAAPRIVTSHQLVAGRLQRAALQHRLKQDGLIRVGSGLFSTAADLARFLRLHLDSGERFAEMRRDQTGGHWHLDPMGGSNAGYGLGWQLGGGAFFHAGAFGSLIWADHAAGLGVVLLTQMPIMQVYAFWREMVRAIRHQNAGTADEPTWPPQSGHLRT
jgi:CubicO group peptidase (beta-lactamase class C family)